MKRIKRRCEREKEDSRRKSKKKDDEMIAKIVEKIYEKNTIMREELKKDREESNKILTNALESIVSSIKITDKDDKNMEEGNTTMIEDDEDKIETDDSEMKNEMAKVHSIKLKEKCGQNTCNEEEEMRCTECLERNKNNVEEDIEDIVDKDIKEQLDDLKGENKKLKIQLNRNSFEIIEIIKRYNNLLKCFWKMNECVSNKCDRGEIHILKKKTKNSDKSDKNILNKRIENDNEVKIVENKKPNKEIERTFSEIVKDKDKQKDTNKKLLIIDIEDKEDNKEKEYEFQYPRMKVKRMTKKYNDIRK